MSEMPQLQFLQAVTPTPEMIAYQKAEAAEIWAARQRIIQFGAILCICRLADRWTFDSAPSPPQADCMVHGTFMMSPDGTMLA